MAHFRGSSKYISVVMGKNVEKRRIPGPNKQSQSKKFRDKAVELGYDEDERAFDEKLKRLVKAKPEKGKPAD